MIYLLGSMAAAFAGVTCLALSQQHHYRTVFASEAPLRKQLVLRTVACLVLALSLALVWLSDGPSFGILFWLLALALWSVVVAMILAYAPAFLARLSGR